MGWIDDTFSFLKSTGSKAVDLGKTIYQNSPSEVTEQIDRAYTNSINQLLNKAGVVRGDTLQTVQLGGTDVDLSRLNLAGRGFDLNTLTQQTNGLSNEQQTQPQPINTQLIAGISNTVLFIGVGGLLVYLAAKG